MPERLSALSITSRPAGFDEPQECSLLTSSKKGMKTATHLLDEYKVLTKLLNSVSTKFGPWLGLWCLGTLISHGGIVNGGK